MAGYVVRESDVQEIIKCMEMVAESLKAVETKEPAAQGVGNISSMEIARMFKYQHTKVFNMITKYISTEAAEEEKGEFQFADRTYNRNQLKHKVCYLTEKGCGIYLEKICSAEFKKSRHFAEGAEKLLNEIKSRYGAGKLQGDSFLMDGRSRMECGKIKEIFDRFITGPGLEKREIAELTEKYRQFYEVMKKSEMKARQSNEIEEAVFGVAIEAEMQGFIYGFRLYEELLNRQIVVV